MGSRTTLKKNGKDAVIVYGTAEINWSVELPKEHAWDGQMCKDPAVEAVLCSVDTSHSLYLFGQDKPPADVFIEVNELDVTVEDDPRDPPPELPK